MRASGRLPLCVLLGALAGLPSVAAAAPAPAPPAAGTALRTLVEAYWQEYLPLHPLEATEAGDHRYDAILPNDLAPEQVARAYDLERRYLARLAAVDPAALAPADAITYAAFRYGRETAIEGFRYPAELLPFDQFRGMPQDLARLGSGRGAQPFRTTAEYDAWLRRLAGFPAWVDQAIVNMRRGSARGYAVPRVVAERMLALLAALDVADPAKSVFLAPVAAFPKSVAAADQARLRTAFQDAVSRDVGPAYRRLRAFVRDEYLPRARAGVAFSELPLGDAWYAYLVRSWTTTRMTPDQVHQVGLDEVRRIGAEMDRVIAGLGFAGDRRAFLEKLRADPSFYFEREEDLLAGYAALKERVHGRLPELFDLLPRAGFEIRAVEPFRAASASSASYHEAATDGSRPGVFYVNTYDLKSRPKYLMQAIYLHEAEPGHHLQNAVQRELPGLPSFRRFGGYGAYDEGWGLYAESLGKDLGLYEDPYDYFGALSTEIWRAVRLVVDTGLHAKGWSRQRALDYLLANTAIGATDAAAEIDRYIAMPGQALAYKIGELRIRELRARAERELGSRFDVRAFHRAILDDGALPLEVLEGKIDRVLAAARAAP